MRSLESRLPGHEPEHVACAHVDPPELEDAPACAADAEWQLARLAGAQADGVCAGALDDLDPRRKLEQQLQPVDGAIGAHLEHGVDLGRLERTFRCQAEVDRESGRACGAQADREDECERRGGDGQLGPA